MIRRYQYRKLETMDRTSGKIIFEVKKDIIGLFIQVSQKNKSFKIRTSEKHIGKKLMILWRELTYHTLDNGGLEIIWEKPDAVE